MRYALFAPLAFSAFAAAQSSTCVAMLTQLGDGQVQAPTTVMSCYAVTSAGAVRSWPSCLSLFNHVTKELTIPFRAPAQLHQHTPL